MVEFLALPNEELLVRCVMNYCLSSGFLTVFQGWSVTAHLMVFLAVGRVFGRCTILFFSCHPFATWHTHSFLGPLAHDTRFQMSDLLLNASNPLCTINQCLQQVIDQNPAEQFAACTDLFGAPVVSTSTPPIDVAIALRQRPCRTPTS